MVTCAEVRSVEGQAGGRRSRVSSRRGAQGVPVSQHGLFRGHAREPQLCLPRAELLSREEEPQETGRRGQQVLSASSPLHAPFPCEVWRKSAGPAALPSSVGLPRVSYTDDV